MNHCAPTPDGVTTPPDEPSCREYLGRQHGYCDGAIQTHDIDGRGFCTEHAKERDL